MIWVLLVVFVLRVLLSDELPLLGWLTETSHDLCLARVPASMHLALSQAILCGEGIHDLTLKTLFIGTGIYHIAVVSGAHFAFLQRSLRSLKIPAALQVVFLLIYLFLTGFQAACVRGFIGRYQKNSLQLTLSVRHLVLLFICLIIEPRWLSSLSLQLSTACCLVVGFFTKRVSRVQLGALVFIACAPLLWKRNYFAIVWNALFADVFAFFVGFISVVESVFHRAFQTWQFLFDVLLRLLKEVAPSDTTQTMRFLPSTWSWIWIGAIFICCHRLEVCKRRRICCFDG